MPVVIVPVYNAPDESIRCFESLIAHTPSGVDVLVIDDCGNDRLAFKLLDSVAAQSGLNFTIHRMPTNSGFILACNAAFETAASLPPDKSWSDASTNVINPAAGPLTET